MNDKSIVNFDFKYSDFLPEGYTNTKPIEDALLFLEEYEKKVWRKMINHKGEKVRLRGGIIFNTRMNDTKNGVSFFMNAFWYMIFINTSKGYDTGSLNTALKLHSLNTLMFYNWLIGLKPEGTTIKIETLNQSFETNYINFSKLEMNFLKPIKNELDSKSNVSFNFSKNDQGHINIVPYYLDENKNIKDVMQKPIEIGDKKKINRKVRTLQDKHELSKENCAILKGLFKKYEYGNMNKIFKDNKTIFNGDLKGDDFMHTFSQMYPKYV